MPDPGQEFGGIAGRIGPTTAIPIGLSRVVKDHQYGQKDFQIVQIVQPVILDARFHAGQIGELPNKRYYLVFHPLLVLLVPFKTFFQDGFFILDALGNQGKVEKHDQERDR